MVLGGRTGQAAEQFLDFSQNFEVLPLLNSVQCNVGMYAERGAAGITRCFYVVLHITRDYFRMTNLIKSVASLT